MSPPPLEERANLSLGRFGQRPTINHASPLVDKFIARRWR